VEQDAIFMCIKAQIRSAEPAVGLQPLFGKPAVERLGFFWIFGQLTARGHGEALLSEFPGEVFDASTTGISEVDLHFHKQPTTGPCLGCVYPHTPQEDARRLTRMCTVTFIARRNGYVLGMNRDEKLTRAAGLPPRLTHLNGL